MYSKNKKQFENIKVLNKKSLRDVEGKKKYVSEEATEPGPCGSSDGYIRWTKGIC